MTPTENFNYKIKNCKKQQDFECIECNKGFTGPKCKPLPIDNCISQRDLKCYKCRKFYRLVDNKCIEPPMKRDCVDLKKDCQQFVRDGKCEAYKNIAEKVCKRSCNLCPINLNQLMYYKNFTTDKSQLSGNLKGKYKKIYNNSIEIKDNLLFYLENTDANKIRNTTLINRLDKIKEEELEDLKLRKLNESLHNSSFYLKWDQYINEQDENRDEQDILSDKYLKQDPNKILSEYDEELDEMNSDKINKLKNKIKNKFRKEREERDMKKLIEEEELDEIREIERRHLEEEEHKAYLRNLILQEEEDENLIRGNKISDEILMKEQEELAEEELKQKLRREKRKIIEEENEEASKLKSTDEKVIKQNKIRDNIRLKEKIRQEKLEEEALDEQKARLNKEIKKVLQEQEEKNKLINDEINKSMLEEEERLRKIYEEEEELILEERRREELERKIREARLRKERIMIGLAIALFIIIVLILYRFVLKKN